jgi:hypothetical protein
MGPETGEREMQRVDEYRFYELGQKIHAIHGIQSHTDYNDVWYQLWDARSSLRQLKTDVVGFRVSIPVVDRVINAITAIVPIEGKDAVAKMTNEGSPSPEIGWPYNELAEALRQFEPILAAECNALDTYVISQKRGYSTPDLVDRAHVMLSSDAIRVLNGSVVTDIQAAGRCLAFDVPTAAGFHVLRAVEAVMSSYYTHLTGRDIPKQNRNWGLYLKKLKTVQSHDPKIWGALDHIRDNYRNPIAHPEDTLTEGEAIMLFGLSLSVIELMAEVLRTLPPALTELEELHALAEIAEQKAGEQDNF